LFVFSLGERKTNNKKKHYIYRMLDNPQGASRARLLLILLCAALLCACAAPARGPASAPTQPTRGAAVPGTIVTSTPITTQPAANGPTPAAAASAPDGAAAHCPDLPPETEQPAVAPAAGQDKQPEDTTDNAPNAETEPEVSMPISYDAATNTILLVGGAPITLPGLARALAQPRLLRELAPGEWLLNANLRISNRAQLEIAGPAVRRLKLRSDPQGFIWIKAFGAQLTFADTCVTSWDSGQNSVDINDADGRSFVLARGASRMDIRGSELSYLGYYANESYGVAWRQPGTTGSAIDSRFGHNFYGMYSYEASDLVIRGNEVHHSTRYGIDPHTRSNRLLIEGNISHHNGKQGIILAEECGDSTIRGNTVYANALHGIVIYQRSNNNVVEGNTSYGNGLQGININDSSGNTLRANTTYDNADAGIGVGQNAANNQLAGNTVRDNRKDGITFYSDATGNTLRDNIVSGNARYGIYVKSANNLIDAGTQVFGNAIGIYLNVTPAPTISLEANHIHDNRDQNVRVGGG
jgi:parallel beta-helix repeat protein